MTETSTPATIRVGQFVVVGHQSSLDMPGYGKQSGKALEVDPPHRFVYTFTPAPTLSWRLEPQGAGTRVFLEHSGFNLDDTRMADAFDRMGAGWRDVILPRLADVAGQG